MDNKANDFEHDETIGTLFGKPTVVNADLDKDADGHITFGDFSRWMMISVKDGSEEVTVRGDVFVEKAGSLAKDKKLVFADDEATKGFERILKNKYPWIDSGENINESKDGNNERQS